MTHPGFGELPDHVTGALPENMRRAFRAEVRRSFKPPYETPTVIVINAVLMAGCWFLLPPDWFFRVHAPLFFPIGLLAWMLADVPTTNVLGSDAVRTAAALDQPVYLRRILFARMLVLSLLSVPIAAISAVVVGISNRESLAAVITTLLLLVIGVWGPLAVGPWLGIHYPYHPISVRLRWESRKSGWAGLSRWGTLVILPYMWVPWAGVAIALPVLALWHFAWDTWPLPGNWSYVWLVLSSVLVAGLATWIGMRVTIRHCARHAQPLREFLADPMRG